MPDPLSFILGQLGISLNTNWKAPKNPFDPEDINAAERALIFILGWFAEPIYGSGNYPAVMLSRIARRSKEQGMAKSRLPEFTDDDIKMIKRKLCIEIHTNVWNIAS